MQILLLITGIILIFLMLLIIKILVSPAHNNIKLIDTIKTSNDSAGRELRTEISASVQTSIKNLSDIISMNQKTAFDTQSEHIIDISRQLNEQLKLLENRFRTLESANEQKLDAIRQTMTNHLTGIQEENSKKLDAIQQTVNEKLENKMNESFRLVSERLEQVYKGLGEMQNIASGVGDLKKVLSNVKTRGILGEIQLGAILAEILSPEQYEKEISVIPESSERVEFAVKLPGNGDGQFIYLPIDSKFPGDTFSRLQDAYESGNPETVAEAKKLLQNIIKKCAKDIHDKYIEPPYTTNFGIMFLPFEGLYAEVVNSGLIEILQRDYNVNVAGPSTMAAMLNSLQMGFQTLAIQKKSSQAWEVLGAVKSEFSNFSSVLEKTQKHIQQVDKDLETLVGVRTRKINRTLSSVESLENSDVFCQINIKDE